MFYNLYAGDAPSPHRADVARGTEVRVGALGLPGLLVIPPGARGLILFAHGSGSSRHSPRNNAVAAFFHDAGWATLLFDLLTEEEDDERRNTFDIPLLVWRLVEATSWIGKRTDTGGLPVGYFGGSTSAAAALVAAATVGPDIAAVVSRGGRPDLAGDALGRVQSPTLLIVGENDPDVLVLNRKALRQLKCEKSLAVVPGARHLFEEPGAMEEVMQLARIWYSMHLQRPHGQLNL